MNDKHSLCKSAQYVKGVGPKKIKILNSLDIQTVKDLLYHFPFRYEDRSRLKTISTLKPGQYQSLKAEVLAMGVRRAGSGRGIFEMAVGDDTGKLFTVWFNQPYMKNYFKAGDKLFLYGKVEKRKRLEIINPECELIPDDDKGVTIHTGRTVPIYPLTRGIGQRTLRKIIFTAIEEFAPLADEFLPFALRRKHNLLHITASLKNIHFPESRALLSEARCRLIFEEFFNFLLVMALRKK
ncbi:MAG: DNA helicase RecG, partial [Candidatus Omnitrophica bacterium]|nr:DNA helicase RecG [Candidatus Omnitrophota bacterium]